MQVRRLLVNRESGKHSWAASSENSDNLQPAYRRAFQRAHITATSHSRIINLQILLCEVYKTLRKPNVYFPLFLIAQAEAGTSLPDSHIASLFHCFCAFWRSHILTSRGNDQRLVALALVSQSQPQSSKASRPLGLQ
jgi:hypothetical protein